MSPRLLPFIGIFALFWTGCTLYFVQMICTGLLDGLQTYAYSETPGIVSSSALEAHGDTHSAEVKYEYTVQGRRFTGTRIRYGTMAVHDRAFMQGLSDRFKKNAPISVYYARSNPAEAVLEKGVEGSALFLPIIATPFVALTVGLWLFVALGIKNLQKDRPAGGAKVIENETMTIARLNRFPACFMALRALGVSSFVVAYAIGSVAGMNPPSTLVVSAWLLILSIVLGSYFWQRKLILSGRYDVALDCAGATLTLPKTLGRKEVVRIPLDSIEAVRVEMIDRTPEDDASFTVNYVWVPTLQLKDGEEPKQVSDWRERDRAISFAKWLGGKLGKPVICLPADYVA